MTPTDAATFVAVAVLLSAVGLLAAYVPAQKAAAIDPATTLRLDSDPQLRTFLIDSG